MHVIAVGSSIHVVYTNNVYLKIQHTYEHSNINTIYCIFLYLKNAENTRTCVYIYTLYIIHYCNIQLHMFVNLSHGRARMDWGYQVRWRHWSGSGVSQICSNSFQINVVIQSMEIAFLYVDNLQMVDPPMPATIGLPLYSHVDLFFRKFTVTSLPERGR